MLDVGWTELVVIAVVLIIVVGPKDLPPMLRTFGKMMTKMRGMANDFRQQFDEALKEADLDDVRKTLSDAQKLNPAHSLREAMNPLRQMGNEIKADLQKATTTETKPQPEATVPPPTIEPVSNVPAATSAPVAAAPVAADTSIAKAVEKPKRATKAKVSEAAPAKAAAPRKTSAKKSAAKVADAEPAPAKAKKTTTKTKKTGDA